MFLTTLTSSMGLGRCISVQVLEVRKGSQVANLESIQSSSFSSPETVIRCGCVLLRSRDLPRSYLAWHGYPNILQSFAVDTSQIKV